MSHKGYVPASVVSPRSLGDEPQSDRVSMRTSTMTAIMSTSSQLFDGLDSDHRFDTCHFFCSSCPEWCEPLAYDSDDGLLEHNGERDLAADLTAHNVRVDPYTQDLVICDRSDIPTSLLRRFPFIRDGSLVTDLTYNIETGELDSDHKNKRSTMIRRMWGYARLVTTNWWYSKLLFVLILASLIVMGKNANLIFFICLTSADYDNPMPLWPRRFVSASILFLEVFQIAVFYRLALKEFNLKSVANGSGDLISSIKLRGQDRNIPFWALVVFHVLEVDSFVKDFVKYAHPFKARQPFAAFKADGHRAFLIGFRDVDSYRAALFTRPVGILVIQMTVEALTLEFKVLCAIKLRNVSFALLSLPGLFIVWIKGSECFSLMHHREIWWRNIKASYHSEDRIDKKMAQKAKDLHFRDQEWNQEHLDERRGLLCRIVCLFLFLIVVAIILAYEISLLDCHLLLDRFSVGKTVCVPLDLLDKQQNKLLHLIGHNTTNR